MTKTNVQPIPSNSQHHDTPNTQYRKRACFFILLAKVMVSILQKNTATRKPDNELKKPIKSIIVLIILVLIYSCCCEFLLILIEEHPELTE